MTLSAEERAVLREIGPGLPEGERPWAELARRAGVSEAKCLDIMRALIERGVVRRVAAVVRDRDLGYAGNAMVAWRVPEERLGDAGAAVAARPEVSHAYSRETRDGWPFNLYTMVHGRTREATLAVVEELGAAIGATGADDRRVLFSLREFTKRRPDYSAALGGAGGESSTEGSEA
ncbi:MAG: siroheme decarboxylase subunit beta [Planctomycetota bacterium]|jgi:DNA-binding Lrp family transcriptional regulator